MYDYANLLFTGKNCNSRCYECIGERKELQDIPTNLTTFPLRNIDSLINAVNEYKIRDLAFTGTNVDPQLYRYEKELISYVNERLRPETNLSLHTNGLLALRKMDEFNSYDKASISFPSFNSETYTQITKVKQPNLKEIIRQAEVPVKLSMLITPFNTGEIADYVKQVADLGLDRVVIRKLKSREDEFPLENMAPFKSRNPLKFIFGWPVYDMQGIEVTICGFDSSTAKGLFLFSDGRIKDELV